MMSLDVPVTFIFFNKTETTKKVFKKIKEEKPPKLYLISDGARNTEESKVVDQLRKWVEDQIDWNPQIFKIYSDVNLGCKQRIISGLNIVFANEEYSIILEDDCLPKKSFFLFCEKILKHYKNNPTIMMVSGNNLLPRKIYSFSEDYSFSAFTHIWGWGTWKRAWEKYDPDLKLWPELKKSHVFDHAYDADRRFKDSLSSGFDSVYNGTLDTWDYQWLYSVWINNGLSIIPKYNLVVNIGFNLDTATHTKGNMPNYLREVFKDQEEFKKEIRFIDYVVRNRKYDICEDKISTKEYFKFIKYILRKVWHKFVKRS